MSKPKKNGKPPVDAAWIGEFKLAKESRIVLEKYLDVESIARIEAIVAEHRDLIAPHLLGRPTSTAISSKLFEIQKKASELRDLLRGLDQYSYAQLQVVVWRASNNSKISLDLSKVTDDLDSLDVLAAFAARHTPANAGAGVRKTGQRVSPNTSLVKAIAAVVAPQGIKVDSYSPGSKFTKICQAICDSGGFEKDTFQVEGSVKAFVATLK